MSDVAPVSEEEFRGICEFLYRRTGMVFTEAKRYYVERRDLRSHERHSASRPSASYFAYLRSDADGEIEKFVNAFTVNETYFYREDHQLRCLSSDLLAERVRAKRPGEAMRIWSVPCSTGEEPYSIAIWLLENWPRSTSRTSRSSAPTSTPSAWRPPRAGEYGKRALMRLSPEL